MYEIYIDNGEGEKLLYRPNIEELALSSIKYKPVAGSAGTLSFGVPVTHPLYREIEPLNTDFWLYHNKRKVFRGRHIGSKEDFYRTGLITCEGDLNYLCDSLVDPYEYTGGIQGFVEMVIAQHNDKVEPRKQFKVGNIQVVDANDYLNRKNSNYSTSADALKDKLVNSYGGYFKTRYAKDGTYIDYVYNMGVSNQVIRFGVNLIDIEKVIDPTTICTCLVPLGYEMETDDPNVTGASKRLDISSVNEGKKYIINEAGIKKWGYIWATHTWDDVTVAENLKRKAEEYLAEQITLPSTMTLTAVDLSLIDATVDDFEVGQYIKIESPFHNQHISDGGYILEQAEIDISNPANSTITLGGKVTTMTNNLNRATEEAKKNLTELAETTSSEIRARVEATSKNITGGNGGYIRIHFADETDPDADHHPDEILVMDTDNINTAKNVIRINQNGIGFSTKGYDPDVFDTAWSIDSTFYADFITAGTMLADRIRGGKLIAGGIGNGETGVISVLGSDNETEKVRLDENGINIKGGSINLGGGTWDSSGLILPSKTILSASNIRGGTLTLGGSNDTSGRLVVNGSDGKMVVTLDHTGIDARAGRIVGGTVSGGTVSGATITGGTVSGATITAGGNNNVNGKMVVKDASGNDMITLSKDGMNVGSALLVDSSKAWFMGDVFRVYNSNRSGAFSSMVNYSYRTWKDSNQQAVYAYIGNGAHWECNNQGKADSGLVYLTGANADVIINGVSVMSALKTLQNKGLI